MAEFLIGDLEKLDAFAYELAQLLLTGSCPPLFLNGPLGSGKTMLTSRIASFFPNGDKAEPASPSFTLCNLYPTTPPILHCDLYRCHRDVPEEISEFLELRKGQLIVEWAEFFPWKQEERLDILINVVNDTRWLKVAGVGCNSASVCSSLEISWRSIAGKKAVK